MQTQIFAIKEDLHLFEEYALSRNAIIYPRFIEGGEKIMLSVPENWFSVYMAWEKSRVEFVTKDEITFFDSDSDALELSYGFVEDGNDASIKISRGRLYLRSWSWIEEDGKQPQWLVDEYKAMRRWITKTAYPYPWAPRCKVYIFPAAMKLLEGKNVEIV